MAESLNRRAPSHVIVGTPQLLAALVNSDPPGVHLQRVKMIVLDEVDHLMHNYSMPSVVALLDRLKAISPDAQCVFVSATITDEVRKIADLYMRKPVEIHGGTGSSRVVASSQKRRESAMPPFVKHYAFLLKPDLESSDEANEAKVREHRNQRLNALTRVHAVFQPRCSLVFVKDAETAEEVAAFLRSKKFRADAFYNGITKRVRHCIIRDATRGQIDFVVATEMMARGLDLNGVTHVINFEPPADARAYLHRAGRIGRLEQLSTAASSFVVTAAENQFGLPSRDVVVNLVSNLAGPIKQLQKCASDLNIKIERAEGLHAKLRDLDTSWYVREEHEGQVHEKAQKDQEHEEHEKASP